MHRAAWIEVNLKAIRQNIRNIKALIGDTKIMAVVKADAYGHGAVEVSRVALEEGVYALAVSNLDEAIELREAKINCPILILGWSSEECFADAVKYDITLAMFDLAEASKLADIAAKLGKKAKVHLKIDTGMSRIGLLADDNGIKTAVDIMNLDNLEVRGAFSHFAKADEQDKSAAQRQFAVFNDFCAKVEQLSQKHFAIKHIANSAAIMEMPETHLDMVRAGIIIYGHYPSKEMRRDILKLNEAMSLRAKISRVECLKKGSAIGYGGTYRLEKDTLVATAPVGYADGYNRLLSNHGKALYRNKLLPIIGRVCMDQLMLDAQMAPEIKKGEVVTLIGGENLQISAEAIADMIGSISYEVDCLLKIRLPRRYIDEN